MPKDEEASVSYNDASDFGDQLRKQFGYIPQVQEHPLYDLRHQHIVCIDVRYFDIERIVNFMKIAGFGSKTAEQWWLNAIYHVDKPPMITGIQTDTIPVSNWIHKLPKG